MNERAVRVDKKRETGKDFTVSRHPIMSCKQRCRADADNTFYRQRNLGNQTMQYVAELGVVQAKLNIGQPNDKYEQEADRVAERVMRMPEGTPVKGHGATVQLKPTCSECMKEEDEDTLQTKQSVNRIPHLNPVLQSQIRTLKGEGRSLSDGTRKFFESRMGHEFGHVRVHTDSRSTDLAGAINARAFTLGCDIVFGEGEYSPGTPGGKSLLAHELTHVVQQTQSSAGMMNHGAGTIERVLEPRIQRENGIVPVELVPVSPEQREQLEELDIELPAVSATTWRLIGGVANHAGAVLAAEERQNIEAYLTARSISIPAQPAATVQGAQFVLHDTASDVGATTIARAQAQNRGPLGLGIAAWVPRDDPLAITRPNFYETGRPTATEYEKAIDVIEQAPREAAFRQVWTATSDSERTAAMTRGLAGLQLTPEEIQDQSTRATQQLNASSGMIYTAASWAIREICAAVDSQGVAAVARSQATEADLTAGCTTLRQYFIDRNTRVGSAVNVELVQQEGSNCRVTGTLEPLRPYTQHQYEGAVNVYLRAALAAGRFPEVTTHFWVDRQFRGHCDPRCFDLMNFYNMIAAAMGHGIGSTYGDAPNYGYRWGTNNVWWQDTVCGGSPPTQSP